MHVICVRARRGSYYFIPHGPLIVGDYFEIFSAVLDELKSRAKKDGMSFIRCNSQVKNTQKNAVAFCELGFRWAPMHEHAEDTHLLDLAPSEEELLGNMRSKDKYYINRAIKE